MSMKTILLGSTAGLLLAGGSARAADAVIAPEPEPVEYVRVCDTYGTGFYYIPGTEICLKVGGYFRYDIAAGDLLGEVSDTGDDTWFKRARFQLRVDARTETELGTLRGYAAFNINWVTNHESSINFVDGDGDGIIDPGELVSIDDFDARDTSGIEHAYVELGGFRIGVTDSYFVTFVPYAGGIVQDDLIPFGPYTTHQIAYTYEAGNGFSVGAAVEEGSDGEAFGTIIDDYEPHVVAGFGYKTGLFAVSAVGGYDSVEDEFSAKGRIDVTPIEMFSLFAMGAWTDDDDGSGGNYYAQWGGDWALWTGATVKVSDRIAINGQFSYNELNDYAAVVDANVTVVPNFVVTPGVGFKHFDDIDDDQWGGYLRTQFTF